MHNFTHFSKHLLRWCFLCWVLIFSSPPLFSQGFTKKAQLVIVYLGEPKGPFRVGSTHGLRLRVKNVGKTPWSGQFIAKTTDGSIEQHHRVTNLRPQEEEGFTMKLWSPTHTGQHNMNFYYQTDLEGRGIMLETIAGIRNPFIFHVEGEPSAPTPRLSLLTDNCEFFPNAGAGGGTTELVTNTSYRGLIVLQNQGNHAFNGSIILRKRDAQGRLHDFIKVAEDPISILAGRNYYLNTRNYTPEVEANYTIEVYAQPKNGKETHVGGFRIQVRKPKAKRPFSLSLVPNGSYFMSTKNGSREKTDLQVGTQYYAHIMVRNDGEEDFRGKLILRKRDAQGNLSHFINMDEAQQTVAGGRSQLFKTRPYTSEKAASFHLEVYAQPNQGAEKFVGRFRVTTHNPSNSGENNGGNNGGSQSGNGNAGGGNTPTPSKADVRLEGGMYFTKMQQSASTTELYRGEYYQLHFKLRNHGKVPFHGRVFTTKRNDQAHFLDPYNTDYTIAAGQTVNVSTRSLNPGTLGSHTADLWIMPHGEKGIRLGSITFVVKDKSSTSQPSHPTNPSPPSQPSPTPTPRPQNALLVCNATPEVRNQQGQMVSTLVAGMSYTIIGKITNQGNAPFNEVLYLRSSSGQNLAQSSTLRLNKGQTLPVAFSFVQKPQSASSLHLAIYTRNNVAYTAVKGTELSIPYQAHASVPQTSINIATLSPDINQLVPQEAYPEQTLYYHFIVTDSKKQPLPGVTLTAKWEKSGQTVTSTPSTSRGIVTFSVPMSSGPRAAQQDRIVYVSASDSKHNTLQVTSNGFSKLPSVTTSKGHVDDALEREVSIGGDVGLGEKKEQEQKQENKAQRISLPIPDSLSDYSPMSADSMAMSYAPRLKPEGISNKTKEKLSFTMGAVWERDPYSWQYPVLPEYIKTNAEADIGIATKFSFGVEGGNKLVNNFLKNLLSAEAKANLNAKISTKFNVRSAANTIVGVALTSLRELAAEHSERKWVRSAISMLDAGIDYTLQRMNPMKGEVGLSIAAKISGKADANMPKWSIFPNDFQGVNAGGSAAYKLSFGQKYVQIGNTQNDLHESFSFDAYAEGHLTSPLLEQAKNEWGNKYVVSLETTTKRKIYGWDSFENYGASMKYNYASIPSARRVRFVNGIETKYLTIKGGINLNPELQPSETIDYGGKIYSHLWSHGQSKFYGIALNKARLRDYLKNQRFLQPQLSDLKEGVKITEQNNVEVTGGWEIDELSIFGNDLSLVFKGYKDSIFGKKLPIPEVDIKLKYKFPAHRNSYYHEQAQDYLTTDSYTPNPDLAHATAQRIQDDVQQMWTFMGEQFKKGLNDVAVWCRERGIQLIGEFGNSIVEYTNKTRNYLTSLFGGSSTSGAGGGGGGNSWARSIAANKPGEIQFSRIKFTFEGGGKVFPMGTHYDFSHTYPAGQATGTVAATGEKFVIISDIFYLNAESPEGKAFLAAPNGAFSVNTSVGRDDLASLSLDPRSKVMLYHLPQGNDPSLWEVVGPVGKRLQCRGLGCYALGVSLQKDNLPPIINCRVDASQRQLLIDVRDNVGVNWNSLNITVNGQIRTFRQTEENGPIIVRLFDADLKDVDNINIWISASDLSNNTARFAQSPQPTAIENLKATDVPTCSYANGVWTLLTDGTWQGADYYIISLNGTTVRSGKIDAESILLPTNELPVATFLLRLSQAQRTHTTTFINTQR